MKNQTQNNGKTIDENNRSEAIAILKEQLKRFESDSTEISGTSILIDLKSKRDVVMERKQ